MVISGDALLLPPPLTILSLRKIGVIAYYVDIVSVMLAGLRKKGKWKDKKIKRSEGKTNRERESGGRGEKSSYWLNNLFSHNPKMER